MPNDRQKLQQKPPVGRLASWRPFANLRYHLALLRWLVPLGLMLLVIAYELILARWIYYRFGFTYHLVAEILLFATVGPALAFILLDFLWRWLDEKDTSDFQSQLLAQAREHSQKSHQLCDDALQTLFAAGTLIDSLKLPYLDASPELKQQVEATEQELHRSIHRLRSHLHTLT